MQARSIKGASKWYNLQDREYHFFNTVVFDTPTAFHYRDCNYPDPTRPSPRPNSSLSPEIYDSWYLPRLDRLVFQMLCSNRSQVFCKPSIATFCGLASIMYYNSHYGLVSSRAPESLIYSIYSGVCTPKPIPSFELTTAIFNDRWDHDVADPLWKCLPFCIGGVKFLGRMGRSTDFWFFDQTFFQATHEVSPE